MVAPSRNQVPRVEDTAAPFHNQVPPVEDSHRGQLHCQEKDFLLYAYSAIYDDQDQKNSLYIRVVASSENSEIVGLSCLIFYSGQVQPEVTTPLYESYSPKENYTGKLFREGIYSCPRQQAPYLNLCPSCATAPCQTGQHLG